MIGERQLVCIYGAASPNTDRKAIHHLLGVLEVERTQIDSWDKMSDAAKERNVHLGRREKWRYAMPVRRAWRTSHTLDVQQVLPRSYDPNNGRYIARFGTWLVPDEARWVLEKVPFVETNVYGETPAQHDEQDGAKTGSIALFLKPSKGASTVLVTDHTRSRTSHILCIWRSFRRLPLYWLGVAFRKVSDW